jgi:hypothetical protein
MVEAFLAGVVATMFWVAGAFFFRFWRETRDALFLSFSAAFLIEGLTRLPHLWAARPSQGEPWVYWVRFVATLLILAAIVRKNAGKDKDAR